MVFGHKSGTDSLVISYSSVWFASSALEPIEPSQMPGKWQLVVQLHRAGQELQNDTQFMMVGSILTRINCSKWAEMVKFCPHLRFQAHNTISEVVNVTPNSSARIGHVKSFKMST